MVCRSDRIVNDDADRFQIAAEVAAPLGKTEEIVLLTGEGGKLAADLGRVVAQIPPTINALTGIDLSKVC